MRALLLLLALSCLAPRAQAYALGVLDASSSSPGLLDQQLTFLDEGSGGDAGAGSHVTAGLLYAMGGTASLVLGGIVTVAAIYQHFDGGFLASALVPIGLAIGVPLLVLGVVGLVAAHGVLTSPTGSAGETSIPFPPSLRAETDRIVRPGGIPPAVSMALSF